MLSYVFDFVFVLIVLGSAFLVSRGGMVNSGIRLVAVLIASLLSIGNFEKLARWLGSTYLTSTEEAIAFHLFYVSAIGLFVVCLAILLWGVHRILPVTTEASERTETVGRWGFGIMTGYLMAAFLLTVIQTVPGPRDFWGALPPDPDKRTGLVMSCAPDCQFLALAEYTLDKSFPVNGDWRLDRPLISEDPQYGRWVSFPYRYRNFRSEVLNYFGESEE